MAISARGITVYEVCQFMIIQENTGFARPNDAQLTDLRAWVWMAGISA